MRKRDKIFLILFIAILSCTFVRAQQHYTTANGLPSNTVYNSFRDSKGYIWFGTDKGVSRFDGKNFKVYNLMSGIPDNTVINFFEDNLGRLWLFSYNGGNCFIYKDKVFNASNDPLLAKMQSLSFIRTMCNGADSSIYIGYNFGTLLKIKDTTITLLVNNRPATFFCALHYKNDSLTAYYEDGKMLFVKDKPIQNNTDNNNTAYVYDNTTFYNYQDNIQVYRDGMADGHFKDPIIKRKNIIKLQPYNHDHLFGCSYDGLLLIDYKKATIKRFLNGITVTSICQDIAGNYWITTLSKGIYMLAKDFDKIQFVDNIADAKIKQLQNDLYKVSKDSLFEFDNLSLKEKQLNMKYNNYSNLICDNDRYLVFGNLLASYIINKKTGNNTRLYFDNGLDATFKSGIHYNDNLIMIGTQILFDLSLKNNLVHKIYDTHFEQKILKLRLCDKNQCIYLITNRELYEYQPTIKKLTAIDSLPLNTSYTSLYCFDNHIAVTTSNNELIIYTTGKREKKVYSLKRLFISDIIQMNNDRTIAATSNGYYLLKLTDTLSFNAIVYPFNRSDISNVYTCGDNLLMEINENLYKVDPTLINTHITRPVFFINNVLVNNVKDTSRHITIKDKGNSNITVSLNALYFGNPNISYKYRFIKDNNSSQWFHSDGGEFNLSLPSYGDYKVEFAAVTDNNNTSNSQFLYVSWPPPFYLTWWFFTIIGLLFIALIVYMVYLNNQRRKLKFEKEMDQLQLEHKAINSLLNPHFVFNAINNIQNLVNKYRVDDANEYLARLSRLIRQNIENLQFNLITADKELSLIRNYIYLQNLRFNDKIHLQINNSADTDKLCLPPLLIHTFVENSVVHGFSPDIKDFTITIDIHPDGKDYVAITITDNGLGLNKPTQAQQALKEKTSIGVDATRRRLQKLSEFYKVQYKLDITDRQATEGTSGARVSIRFYAHFGNLLPVS